MFLQRGGDEEEGGEVPGGAVLTVVACCPERASEKLGWALSQFSACWPVLSHEVSVDTRAWAVLSQLTCDMTFPTEALGLISSQTPQFLPSPLMLPKNSQVWSVKQLWCVLAGKRKDVLYFPRTVD